MTEASEEVSKGVVEGVIEALTDKHSQLDVRLQGLTMRLGGTPVSIQLSGNVTVAVHMRQLTDEEKTAHATSNIAQIQA